MVFNYDAQLALGYYSLRSSIISDIFSGLAVSLPIKHLACLIKVLAFSGSLQSTGHHIFLCVLVFTFSFGRTTNPSDLFGLSIVYLTE